MLKGLYSKVDSSCYIRSLYITFLHKYMTLVTADQGKSGMLVENIVGQANERVTKGMTSIILKFFAFHCEFLLHLQLL